MVQWSMCRICLVEEVKMHVINPYLQELYEKLTAVPFQSADRKPLQVCYICFARLRHCYHLQVNCIKSEELFTQMLNNNKSKPKTLQNMITLKIDHPVQLYSCVPEVPEYLQHDAEFSKIELINVAKVKVEENEVESFDDHIRHRSYDNPVWQVNKNVQENEGNMYVRLKQENIDVVTEESFNSHDENSNYHIKQQNVEEHNTIETDKQHGESNIINKIEDIETKIDLNQFNYIESSKSINTKTTGVKNKIKKQFMLYKDTHFKNVDAIIENNIQLDRSIQSGESEDINLKTVKIVLNRIDLDCVKTKEPVFNKPKKQQEHKEKNENNKYRAEFKKNKEKNTKQIKIGGSYNAIDNFNKQFMCEICGKCYYSKGSLGLHTRIHTGEKPYTCEVCEKSFSHKGDLVRHVRTHSEQKIFKCDICHRGFNENCKLTLHYRKHTGERPYICDGCNKEFSDKNNLIRHTRVHTGIKPYKCDLCKKRFSEKCGLKSHTRIHTGERPFKCDKCEKTYRFRNDLKYHKRRHIAKTI